MKNKKSWVGILAVVLVFGLVVTGCGGDNPKRVKEVKVTQLSDGTGWVLSWEAVGKNVAMYSVYAKQEDKSSVIELEDASATNLYVYSNSTPVPNSDNDKWYALVYKDDLPSGSWYFGVRTMSTYSDYSNIRWTKEKYTK